MGNLRPRIVHPDMLEALQDLEDRITALSSNKPVRVVSLTTGSRGKEFLVDCICWLEELASGKTKVHLTTGKNTTVDQSISTVRSLILAA